MKRSAKSKLREQEFNSGLAAITPELWARAEARCEARILAVCMDTGQVYLHRHHRRSRRVRGDGKVNSLSNLLAVCTTCHAWIHKERKWAKEHGLIISQWSDPDEIEVLP